jgi:PAS domain S-box-containing protein
VRSGFVTNEALDVLEFLGDTSPYLRFMPGRAVLNLRRIAMPPLYREVLATVKKTAKTRVARRPGVSLLLGTGRKKINIEVTRLKAYSAGGICYRILLEEVSPRSGKSAKTKHKPRVEQPEEPEAARLKQELDATKESFSAILAEQDQEHQATLGKLKAAHEEGQATAARLEVTNAQLESSQAELEETAEELRLALAASEQHGQESEGRVRALLETAAQGILAVEHNGRIGLVNRTAEMMFGYRREELLGQPVEMLLPDGLRSVHRRRRREFFAHPHTRPMGQGLDLLARRKDGTTFPVEISLTHIEPEGDTVAAAFISDITERKRAEQSLRESEERFRIAAQCGSDLIYERNLDSNALRWWGDIEASLGYRPATLEVFEKHLHPEDHDRVMDAVQRHLEEGDVFDQQYRIRAKDGTYRYWRDQGMAVRDSEGKPYRWTGACNDITENKRAERELHLQAAITANMAEGIALIRARDAVIVYANERYHELFGYEPGELHGRPVSVLNAGSRAEAKATAQEIIKVLHRDSVWRGEIRNVRKDGTVFWSSTNVTTLEHDEYGAVWLGVLRDVTARKQAETKLHEELAFNTALVDTVRALVVVLDREGRIVRFNKVCQEATGYSFDEVRGRRIWEFLLVPEEAEQVKRVFRRLKAGQFPNQFENYWVTKTGERRLISWSNTALMDDNGAVDFVIGTGIDITEQRQMEETIRRSHNDLRQLTARLTSAQEEMYKHLSRELHDVFSQKLAMLGVQVSEVERKLSAAGLTSGADWGQIGEQISGLASEIHGISRRLHPAILDDLGLAVALKNECHAFTREHGIEVTFHSKGGDDPIPSNVALCLYRVVQESLTNIRKHAEADKARVTLAGSPGEIIVLSIEDFGKGFHPEDVRGRGGLGLVSMEERVRLVGGTLTIQSKPGDGARVLVRVPLKKSGRKRRNR